MRPLYENWNEQTQRHTEVVIDPDTGLPLIVRTQNTRPIIEQNKRDAANYDPTAKRDGAGWTKVATIDANTWAHLCRLGIAYDDAQLKAWLNERDHRLYRTDDGRKL